MARQHILLIESFDGDDTHLHCGDDQQDYLFCVVVQDEGGRLEIVDSGYRSLAEATEAWPDAVACDAGGLPRRTEK